MLINLDFLKEPWVLKRWDFQRTCEIDTKVGLGKEPGVDSKGLINIDFSNDMEDD